MVSGVTDEAFAETFVAGVINTNTTWVLANSPYIVTGNILVSSGCSLLIEAGVEIRFQTGFVMQIDGELIARGTSENRITFTSHSSASVPGDWGHIFFSDSSTDADFDADGNYASGSIMEYCIVEFGGGSSVENNGALRIEGAHPFIGNCTVRDNSASGIFAWNLVNTLTVSDCLITRNNAASDGGGIRALIAAGGSVEIINNTVTDNQSTGNGGGIYIEGEGLCSNCYITISGNTISKNGSGGWGGGIAAYSTVAVIAGNVIADNQSVREGCGVQTKLGNILLQKNLITRNTTKVLWEFRPGGGIGILSDAVIAHNILTHNKSGGNGGGISVQGGQWSSCTGIPEICTHFNVSAIDVSHNVVMHNEAVLGTNQTSGNGGGIWVEKNELDDTATITVNGNNVSGNVVAGSNALGAGVYAANLNDGSFNANSISKNEAPSEGLRSSGLHLLNIQIPIAGNNFYYNSGYDLFCDTPEGAADVEATNVWWGTENESEIPNRVYDWTDDHTKAMVNYSPALGGLSTASPLSSPTGLTAEIDGSSIILNWSANPESDIAGYRIHYDSDSGFPYAHQIDVGNVNGYSFSGLPGNTYIAVTAYDTDYEPGANDPLTPVNENQTAGNESWFSKEIFVDQPEIAINSDALYTGSLNITLSLSFNHTSGVIGYNSSENPVTPEEDDPGWTTVPEADEYSEDVPFVLSAGDGEKTIYVWFMSTNNSISLPNHDAIYLDTSVPSGTLTINNDDPIATSGDATLQMEATDPEGIVGYYVALTPERPLEDDPNWMTVEASTAFMKSITFPLGKANGAMTVYVWYRDAALNVSSAATDTIILDTGPPIGAVSINDGAVATNTENVTLTVTASDSGSGGIRMAFSNDGENFSPWETMATNKNWELSSGDGTKTVYFKFKDQAGFESIVYSNTIILDTRLPVPHITLPQDGSTVTSLVAIAGIAEDPAPSSGLAGVEIKVFNGSVYLRRNGTWGVDPIFFTPDGGTFSTWHHDTNAVSWDTGSTYAITVRALDFAGNMATTTIEVFYGIQKAPSAITCILSGTNLTLGEALEVSGQITPPPTSMGAFVGLTFLPPEGAEIQKTVVANEQGQFSYAVACNDINRSGNWAVRVAWAGDEQMDGAVSSDQALEVSRAGSRLTLDLTSQAIKHGEQLSITGKFTPNPDCGGDMSDLPILLIISGPGGTTTQSLFTHDIWGHYLVQAYNGFDLLGKWTVEAVFSGNDAYEATSSGILELKVVETAGYAVIVQGKISTGEGLDSHNKTANFVYNTLRQRGLLDDDIKYFNYDTTQPVVNAQPRNRAVLPTWTGVENAIVNWARDKMNAKPADLYIIMLDHGLDDMFYIHPDAITSADLSGWLNTLQAGLTGQAFDQEIVSILGFCRSGSFIDDLSGTNRVIITSAASGESSYKGPLDDDGIREGEYFVSEFFKSIAIGKSIKKSFQSAMKLTKVFTAYGGSTQNNNAPYFDASLQHPLLDDNGDGTGSNDLDSKTVDGILSEDLFIGVSSVTGNDPGDVTVNQVTETRFLTSTDTTANLWATVDDDTRLRTIWCEVKPPGYNPVDTGGSGQAEMDLVKTLGVYNGTESRYVWNALEGFTASGTYQVFYFAKDDVTGNVSPLAQSIVYKASDTNNPPNALTLVLPATDATVLTTTILDWADTSDPDGDSTTYTVLLSKDDPTFADPLRIERIENSSYLISPSDGIEDLSTYYWAVQAIDDYGAVTESDTRILHTNNTNPVAAYFTGYVFDAGSGQLLSNASVTINNTAIQTDASGYYLGVLDPGLYDVSLSASGYDTKQLEDMIYPDGEIVRMDIGLVPILMGNIDGNEAVNLTDALITLQVLSGINESGLLRSDYVGSGADVNGDEIVGMAELIYILQFVSGINNP